MTPNDDWSEYEKLVIYRLDKLDERLTALDSRVFRMSAIWGLLGGAITSIAGLFFHPKGPS